MSLALIQESAKEVRRLAIAGSTLAVGDFRLKKLAAPLEQAGAKVPVFAQVAKGINDLVDGKEADSAANLLNLSTLLNAILYTQGQTGADGEVKELEIYTSKVTTTRTTSRVLKPVIEALTSVGGGRFEIVKSAWERGVFNDLRLIEPAVRALDDNYPELADLVAKKILPTYGVGIVPLLKQKLDLKGKKSDARRLSVLHQLDPDGTLELCKSALEQGSPDVKVEAIRCLGKHEDCLPLVLEQTKAKNKTIREAALEASATYDRPDTVKVLIDMIRGKMEDLIASPLRLAKSDEVLSILQQEIRTTFETALKNDGPSIVRFIQLLECLRGRTDAGTEKLLLGCFAHYDKLQKVKAGKDCVFTGADMIREIAVPLYHIGSAQALEAILSHREKVSTEYFRLIALSAVRTWPPDKVYEEFAPLLEQKKGAGKDRLDIIQRLIWTSTRPDEFESIDDSGVDWKKVTWDPRWVDAAIKADNESVVCCLAKPGNKNAVTYLLKAIEGKNQTNMGYLFEALLRCEYPKLTELFIELVKKKTKKAQFFDWELQQLFQCVPHLPVADLPTLDAFATTLDEKFVDRFLEALEPLRFAAKPTT